MFSTSPLNYPRENRTAKSVLPKNLLSQSDVVHTHLISHLNQLSIETDSIECVPQNSKLSSTNYNNSYILTERDHLFALYAQYQIDPQMYPPPNLQFDQLIQPSFHSYLAKNRLSNQRKHSSNNSNRKSSRWRKKPKRLSSPRKSESNDFHYRNMITVRRISCHEMMMKKASEYKPNKRKKKTTRSIHVIEEKAPRYKASATELQLSPPHIKFHTSAKQSTLNKPIISSSNPNNRTKTLTTSIQQQELKDKIAHSSSITRLKDCPLRDLSSSSLISTQLHATAHDQAKPDVLNATSSTPEINSGSFVRNSTQLSAINSSVVPHYSSTIAPKVSHHLSSSIIAMPDVPKTKSVIIPTTSSRSIQDLADQLQTCITMLRLLLPNKTEHENIPSLM